MLVKTDYRELIERHYSKLGKRKKILADKILAAPLEVIGMSIGMLAKCCECDQTTIVRFAQQLGFSGYPELKLAIAQKSEVLWKRMEEKNAGQQSEYQLLCSRMIQMHEESIRKTLMQIPESVILNVAKRIESASCVMVCGAGVSALAAEDLSIKLARLGVKTLFFKDQEMWKSFIGSLSSGDVLIAFSNFGETPSIVEVIGTASKKGVLTIGITSVRESRVGKASDILLHTNSSGELPVRLGAMASRTGQMVVSDLITMVFSQLDKERSWKRMEESYVSYNG